jgi:hypothetical protein
MNGKVSLLILVVLFYVNEQVLKDRVSLLLLLPLLL